jgi:predicted RNase H-like HicB family nuclease
MRFEVVVEQNEEGEFVATAVEYARVSATGRTENEALMRLLEALALHLKRGERPASRQ